MHAYTPVHQHAAERGSGSPTAKDTESEKSTRAPLPPPQRTTGTAFTVLPARQLVYEGLMGGCGGLRQGPGGWRLVVHLQVKLEPSLGGPGPSRVRGGGPSQLPVAPTAQHLPEPPHMVPIVNKANQVCEEARSECCHCTALGGHRDHSLTSFSHRKKTGPVALRWYPGACACTPPRPSLLIPHMQHELCFARTFTMLGTVASSGGRAPSIVEDS